MPKEDKKEEEEEEEEDEDVVMLGLTLGEIMLLGNGLASFCLAFMSLFARSANLPYPAGQSFFSHTKSNLTANLANNPFDLVHGFADAFFHQASDTRGGRLVLESLFALSCCGMFQFQMDLARMGQGDDRLLQWGAFALVPVLAQFGGSTGLVFPLAMLGVSKMLRRRKNASVVSLLDVPKTVLACVGAALFVGLQYVLFTRDEDDTSSVVVMQPAWLGLFLCVPLLPALLGGGAFVVLSGGVLPAPPLWLVSSKPVQLASGVLAIGTFLLIGAFGVSIHTHGFSQFELEMREHGGQHVVDLIVKDCLSNAPSRFVFVQFVHLCLSCITVTMMRATGGGRIAAAQAGGRGNAEAGGGGGGSLGLVLFATTLVGPTGSLALLAAHHEFRLMKARGLF